MNRDELDFQDEEEEAPLEEPEVDEIESIDIRDENEIEAEEEAPVSSASFEESASSIASAELDNMLNEFVDMVNGRDFDGLSDLLAEDVESDFLGEATRAGVIEGLNDLVLRYPTLIVTRGDLDETPIVAVWYFDQAREDFDSLGYFTLDLGESEEALISRIEYSDELPDSEGLVVETPEASELNEWDDWSELDED